MAVYAVGATFSNGFKVIQTPTSPGNNTGLYYIANAIGFQYYVDGSTIATYDAIGNNNNGSGGSSGSVGTGGGGGSASTTASTTIIYRDFRPPGSPFSVVAPSTPAGLAPIISGSGSMVRLVNNSSNPFSGVVEGWDNASTSSGKLLFALQMAGQQSIDIEEQVINGICLRLFTSVNVDGGFNVVYNTGSSSLATGYPFDTIPANSSSTRTIYGGACDCVGYINNSQMPQGCTITGYDNASTTSGRILFVRSPDTGQTEKIGESANYGITIGITGGTTNPDYGVNIKYAPKTS